jgi:sodium transport system permease protein
MLPGVELAFGTSVIPVAGLMLLLRDLIEGHYLESIRFLFSVFIVNSLCVWLAVRWTSEQFESESILFGASERWRPSTLLWRLVRDRGETPTVAQGLCFGVMLVMLQFFAAMLSRDVPTCWQQLALRQIVSLTVFVGIPTLVIANLLTRQPRAALLLKLPQPRTVLLATLLAVTMHPVGMFVSEAVRQWYPFSEGMQKEMVAFSDLLVSMHQSAGIGVALLVLA